MSAKPLLGIGIAVTRPADQAKKLAALISEAGGTPILFPLIEIMPLQDYSHFEAVISEIETYDWAIFISSNAVQNGMPRIVKNALPAKLKFAAIGPVTANELQSFGVKEVLMPQGRFDSESLLSLPEMTNVAGKKIMIIRGVGGRDVLAETLKKRGAQVTFAECYQRENPQSNCDFLTKLWMENKLHGIVVTSSEAMRHLLDFNTDPPFLRYITLYVNHARIAELPLQMGLKVMVANAPGDEGMVDSIKQKYVSMRANREALFKMIQDTFDGVEQPTDITLHVAEAHDAYDYEHDSEHRKNDYIGAWQDVPAAHIKKCHTALSYVNKVGMRYYLPAFMIWYLTHLGTSEISYDHTLYTLDHHADNEVLSPYFLERFSLFNAAQMQVCALFVKFCFTDDLAIIYSDEDFAKTQYEKYWYQFDISKS
jgi:uroporphyrinogen-III synthase